MSVSTYTRTKVSAGGDVEAHIVEVECDCDNGCVEDELVDYGSAGYGWTYRTCPQCGGCGRVSTLVEYVPWLHTRRPENIFLA